MTSIRRCLPLIVWYRARSGERSMHNANPLDAIFAPHPRSSTSNSVLSRSWFSAVSIFQVCQVISTCKSVSLPLSLPPLYFSPDCQLHFAHLSLLPLMFWFFLPFFFSFPKYFQVHYLRECYFVVAFVCSFSSSCRMTYCRASRLQSSVT